MTTGRRAAIVVSFVSVVAMVLTAFITRRAIFEEWYLWKLLSGEKDEQALAALKLGEMQSAKAINPLIGKVSQCLYNATMDRADTRVFKAAASALKRIGQGAIVQMLENLLVAPCDSNEEEDAGWILFLSSKQPYYPPMHEARPATWKMWVAELCDDSGQPLAVRETAGKVLQKWPRR